MLQPKRQKFRFAFRGRRKGVARSGANLSFGDYGLKALESVWLTANQIEAARKTIVHGLRKEGRMWIRVFPDKPVSGRSAGQRMGGGKGEVSRYVAVIKPGRILFEVAGARREIAEEALNKAGRKLPLKTKIVRKA